MKTCVPQKLPLQKLDRETLLDLLERAHTTLAQYDAIFSSVKNATSLSSFLIKEESFHSALPQKHTVSFKEYLIYKTLKGKKNPSLEKVAACQKALENALKKLDKVSLSISLLCDLHKTIKKNSNGKIRTEQNWIGPKGGGIEDASFYPPSPKILRKSLNNLQKYILADEQDPLIQLAIAFAQFLIIHPFMDGNGRVARIFIPLFLYKKKFASIHFA